MYILTVNINIYINLTAKHYQWRSTASVLIKAFKLKLAQDLTKIGLRKF